MDNLKIINTIINRGLNVVKSEELVESIINGKEAEQKTDKAQNIRVFKDVRIFANTIRQAVEMMKKSGIAAQTVKTENDEFIEYSIKIPKNLKNAV